MIFMHVTQEYNVNKRTKINQPPSINNYMKILASMFTQQSHASLSQHINLYVLQNTSQLGFLGETLHQKVFFQESFLPLLSLTQTTRVTCRLHLRHLSHPPLSFFFLLALLPHSIGQYFTCLTAHPLACSHAPITALLSSKQPTSISGSFLHQKFVPGCF